MADLTSDIVAEVIAACKAGTGEAAAAIERNLGLKVKVSVGPPEKINIQDLPAGWSGGGLAVVLIAGQTAAIVLLPESSGLVPSWCNNPGPTGQSKLTTLAQELGMVLLPEQYMPEDFKAGMVKSIQGALARSGVVSGAPMVPLELQQADGKKATACLIWPSPKPAAILGTAAAGPKPAPKPGSPSKPGPASAAPAAAKSSRLAKSSPARPASIQDLPVYARSLLRIKVPVIVTLAEKRQPLGWIVELGPGSIIQFEKSCEEMLELNAGGRTIATGEAVKVGDKFGLRITSIEERFKPVQPGRK
jgi:flagellar motor switch protein FliN/FliY